MKFESLLYRTRFLKNRFSLNMYSGNKFKKRGLEYSYLEWIILSGAHVEVFSLSMERRRIK